MGFILDSLDWDEPARFPDLTLGPWGPNTNVFFKKRGSIYSGGLPPEARQGYQPQLPQLILAVTI